MRARTDLVTQRVAVNNQLEATLDAFWPGAKAVFADVTSKIALSFLERYPTPVSAAALGEKRLAAFCAKHGYSGRRSPQELLERPIAPRTVTARAIAMSRATCSATCVTCPT